MIQTLIADDLVGSTLTSARRMKYIVNGAIYGTNGPLELTFGKRPFVIDAGADGESIVVRGEGWMDPFPEPLSDANRAYVATHGKYVAFDLSDDPSFGPLVGRPLIAGNDVTNTDGTVVGIELTIGQHIVCALAECDELIVDVRSR